MITTLTITVLFAILIAAAYQDLKTLEVPDWINYSGIAAGLGINSIYAAQQSTWSPIFGALLGLGAAFLISSLMYYSGQWGGGDAKLLLAVGSIGGLQWNINGFGLTFLVNLIILGAVWGLAYTVYVGTRNRQRTLKFYKAAKKNYTALRLFTGVFALVLLVLAAVFSYIRLPLIILAAIVFSLSYLVLLIKSVELSGMYKWVGIDKLTEGDWLVHDIRKNGKEIKCGKVGLTTKDLKDIKASGIKKVCVKYGVPFTPAFLLAFIVSLTLGNIIFYAIHL